MAAGPEPTPKGATKKLEAAPAKKAPKSRIATEVGGAIVNGKIEREAID